MSNIRITTQGKTYTISRDVRDEHPAAVHAALGTESESELQSHIDRCHVDDWYDADGQHLGPDVDGLEMFRDQPATEPEGSIDAIIQSIRAAADNLGEWDWHQDFADADGGRHIISGRNEIDSLPESAQGNAREYADWVDQQYADARASAMQAVEALRASDLDRAMELMEQAVREEEATGDAHVMSGPHDALREYIDAAE